MDQPAPPQDAVQLAADAQAEDGLGPHQHEADHADRARHGAADADVGDHRHRCRHDEAERPGEPLRPCGDSCCRAPAGQPSGDDPDRAVLQAVDARARAKSTANSVRNGTDRHRVAAEGDGESDPAADERRDRQRRGRLVLVDQRAARSSSPRSLRSDKVDQVMQELAEARGVGAVADDPERDAHRGQRSAVRRMAADSSSNVTGRGRPNHGRNSSASIPSAASAAPGLQKHPLRSEIPLRLASVSTRRPSTRRPPRSWTTKRHRAATGVASSVGPSTVTTGVPSRCRSVASCSSSQPVRIATRWWIASRPTASTWARPIVTAGRLR